MINASQIKEHMEVVGSDNKHVGRVDHVADTETELSKMDLGAGFKHHIIPMSWIDYVDDDKVRLNMEAAEAKSSWREKH